MINEISALDRRPEPPLDHQERVHRVRPAGGVISGIAAWLQVATILWGPKDLRFPLMTLDWPEDGRQDRGQERIVLDETPGMQAPAIVATSAAGTGAQPAMKPAE